MSIHIAQISKYAHQWNLQPSALLRMVSQYTFCKTKPEDQSLLRSR